MTTAMGIRTSMMAGVLASVVALGAVACGGDDRTATDARGTDATPAPTSTSVPSSASEPGEPGESAGLGVEQPTPRGNLVTVFAVEPLAVPTPAVTAGLDSPRSVVAIDGQFCAAGGSDVRAVGESDFFLVTAGERLLSFWDPPQPLKQPRFPASATVRAGECLRGWVTFLVPPNDEIAAVRWDANGNGGGPFVEWDVAG